MHAFTKRVGRSLPGVVVLAAFGATAIATLFAQATGLRALRRRRPHEVAWTVALVMFALASAALSVGVTTGWDAPTFRVFYLLGAVLNVPWLALGTVYLLSRPRWGRRAQWALVFFSGLATGVVFAAPMRIVPAGTDIPSGREVFGAGPRMLAAVGSSGGAAVILGGALWSAWVFGRSREQPGAARRVAANGCIAAGTLVLAGGGLVQGRLGENEAFALSLLLGIAVIYAGFLIAIAGSPAPVPGNGGDRRPPPLSPAGAAPDG